MVVQARTIGTELNYSSVSLSYTGGNLAGIRTELDRAPFVGQGSGAIVSSAWTWDLDGLNISEFTISFQADGPSLSFDSATLDVKTIPEPGAWALLLIGLSAGRRARFRFASSRRYRIETASALGNWFPAARNFQFSGSGEATWTAETASGSTEQYFRIVVRD